MFLFLTHSNSRVVPADFFLSRPAAFTDSSSACELVRFVNLLFLHRGRHGNNSMRRDELQNKAEASLSSATSGRRPSADRETRPIKKQHLSGRVGGVRVKGAELWGGTACGGRLRNFSHRLTSSTKLTLGLLIGGREEIKGLKEL